MEHPSCIMVQYRVNSAQKIKFDEPSKMDGFLLFYLFTTKKQIRKKLNKMRKFVSYRTKNR
jgi:hypothetical protein